MELMFAILCFIAYLYTRDGLCLIAVGLLMSYNMGEYQASLLWNNGVYKSNYSKAVLKIQERLNQ